MNDVQVIPEHSYTNLSSWLSYRRKNAIKEKGRMVIRILFSSITYELRLE